MQDRDEPGRSPYLDTLSSGSCNAGTCRFTFAAVPAGKRLVATFASASVGQTGPAPGFVVLMIDGGTITSMPAPQPAGSGNRFAFATPSRTSSMPAGTPRSNTPPAST
ncbi:MAG: hypothetical protein ABI585_11375 [Betaproteobacteria bacterium]